MNYQYQMDNEYSRGQMVAVRYQSHWYRARVLEFKPATNFAWV